MYTIVREVRINNIKDAGAQEEDYTMAIVLGIVIPISVITLLFVAVLSVVFVVARRGKRPFEHGICM